MDEAANLSALGGVGTYRGPQTARSSRGAKRRARPVTHQSLCGQSPPERCCTCTTSKLGARRGHTHREVGLSVTPLVVHWSCSGTDVSEDSETGPVLFGFQLHIRKRRACLSASGRCWSSMRPALTSPPTQLLKGHLGRGRRVRQLPAEHTQVRN